MEERVSGGREVIKEVETPEIKTLFALVGRETGSTTS